MVDWLFVVRALHILAAALWVGAAAMLTLHVMPAIRASAAAGGTVLVEAMRRGIGVFMPVVAATTILTGVWLYVAWYRTRGGIHGAGAIMLTLGAVAGFAAAVIGGAVLGRTVGALAELAIAAPTADAEVRIAALHRRGASASRLALALLVASLLLMVLSRSF